MRIVPTVPIHQADACRLAGSLTPATKTQASAARPRVLLYRHEMQGRRQMRVMVDASVASRMQNFDRYGQEAYRFIQARCRFARANANGTRTMAATEISGASMAMARAFSGNAPHISRLRRFKAARACQNFGNAR